MMWRNSEHIGRRVQQQTEDDVRFKLMRQTKSIPHNERQAQTRNRALNVLAQMRRKHLSLAAASRLEHIKPATVLRYVGSAIRQERSGGRYRATKGDRFRRDIQVPTAMGPVTVPVYGSKNAESISKYLNAVGHYLRTGDQARLRPFRGKAIKVGGKKIKLVTDPDKLLLLAEADVLHLDQLYASRKG
jgi:hypothetical protein